MVKTFKAFNESNESNQDIDSICEKYDITNYTINDHTIDVNGDVNLTDKGLTNLPLKFRNVTRNFNCGYNQLITLEGAPQSVGGNFDCSNNELTTLEGSPKSVGVNFYCHSNELTTLKGSPKSVGGNFYCSHNKLKSLEYISNIKSCQYNPISKWFKMIDSNNERDVEAFLDFNIHSDDPDDINQEKIDQINNG